MPGTGLALGYDLHLWTTLSYHGSHDVPLSAHVYHWVGGGNSCTALLHSHLGKAAMSPVSAWLPGRSHCDTGGTLAQVVPVWPLAGIALGFLAASAGALLRMPGLLRGYGPGRCWSCASSWARRPPSSGSAGAGAARAGSLWRPVAAPVD